MRDVSRRARVLAIGPALAPSSEHGSITMTTERIKTIAGANGAAEVDTSEVVWRLILRHARCSGRAPALERLLDEIGVDTDCLAGIVRDLERRFDIAIEATEAVSWVSDQDVIDSMNAALHARQRRRARRAGATTCTRFPSRREKNK